MRLFKGHEPHVDSIRVHCRVELEHQRTPRISVGKKESGIVGHRRMERAKRDVQQWFTWAMWDGKRGLNEEFSQSDKAGLDRRRIPQVSREQSSGSNRGRGLSQDR